MANMPERIIKRPVPGRGKDKRSVPMDPMVSAVLLSTALSCFTLFLWVWGLKSLGLF